MTGIEEHIRRAVEEGKFDDFPGLGKPLRLDENPHEDPQWRMANRMLRDSGFTLPWIETRQEIEVALDQARQGLERAWSWHSDTVSAGESIESARDEWNRAEQMFREQVGVINEKISSYNLQAPSIRLQLAKLDAENEISTIKGDKQD